jgi:hypothetical protein
MNGRREPPCAGVKLALALLLLTSILACQNAKNALLKKAFEKNAEAVGKHIDPAPVHLCSALSADEIRTILGADYIATESGRGRTCRFSPPNDMISPAAIPKENFSVKLELFDGPEVALGFLKGTRDTLRVPTLLGKGMAPQDIPALGEEAFWVHNPQAPFAMAVADDRKFFMANVYSPSEEDAVLVGKVQQLIAKLSGKIR